MANIDTPGRGPDAAPSVRILSAAWMREIFADIAAGLMGESQTPGADSCELADPVRVLLAGRHYEE